MRTIAMVTDVLLSFLIVFAGLLLLSLGMRPVFALVPPPAAYLLMYLALWVLALALKVWGEGFSPRTLWSAAKWLPWLGVVHAAFVLARTWNEYDPTPASLFASLAAFTVFFSFTLSRKPLPFPFFGWGRERDLLSLARRGDVSGMRAFLAEHPEAVNAPSRRGETPLLQVLSNHAPDTEAVATLLAHGADPNQPNTYGMTPLMQAILGGRADLVNLLLDHGVEMAQAVMLSALSGRVEMTRGLLERGADVNTPVSQGITLLHLGAASGNLRMVQFLLERGADINARADTGETPLDYVQKIPGGLLRARGRRQVAAYLRQQGAVGG